MSGPWYVPEDLHRSAGQRRDYHHGMSDAAYARLVARGEGQSWTPAQVAALQRRIARRA